MYKRRGGDRAPAGPLPVKRVGPVERCAAEVGVDRHREAFDAGVEQQIDERPILAVHVAVHRRRDGKAVVAAQTPRQLQALDQFCLLYTSDAADERSSVDLGGRRIIKKKKNKIKQLIDEIH